MTTKKSENEANVPATLSEQAAPVATGFNMEGYEIANYVTRPVLQLPVGVQRGVVIDKPIYEGKEITGTGTVSKKRAMIADCTNLEDGTVCQIVVPAVLEANLREQYPDDGYVGRAFIILNKGMREGKKYNDILIAEVRPKEA